jgi:hypothetical protein
MIVKHMLMDHMVVTNYHNIPLTSSAPFGNEVDVMVVMKKNSLRLPYIHIFTFTSRNQPKCNQSIYDYMRLIVVCD